MTQNSLEISKGKCVIELAFNRRLNDALRLLFSLVFLVKLPPNLRKFCTPFLKMFIF